MVEQKEILSEMRSFAGKGMNFSFYLKDYMLLSKTEILISFFFLKCAVMLMIPILLWTSLCQPQIRKLRATFDIFWELMFITTV